MLPDLGYLSCAVGLILARLPAVAKQVLQRIIFVRPQFSDIFSEVIVTPSSNLFSRKYPINFISHNAYLVSSLSKYKHCLRPYPAAICDGGWLIVAVDLDLIPQRSAQTRLLPFILYFTREVLSVLSAASGLQLSR